jgi:hypothetical protein
MQDAIVVDHEKFPRRQYVAELKIGSGEDLVQRVERGYVLAGKRDTGEGGSQLDARAAVADMQPATHLLEHRPPRDRRLSGLRYLRTIKRERLAQAIQMRRMLMSQHINDGTSTDKDRFTALQGRLDAKESKQIDLVAIRAHRPFIVNF